MLHQFLNNFSNAHNSDHIVQTTKKSGEKYPLVKIHLNTIKQNLCLL